MIWLCQSCVIRSFQSYCTWNQSILNLRSGFQHRNVMQPRSNFHKCDNFIHSLSYDMQINNYAVLLHYDFKTDHGTLSFSNRVILENHLSPQNRSSLNHNYFHETLKEGSDWCRWLHYTWVPYSHEICKSLWSPNLIILFSSHVWERATSLQEVTDSIFSVAATP